MPLRVAGCALLPLLMLLLALSGLSGPAAADDEPDYRGMVERIDQTFTEAIAVYRSGNQQGAREIAQSAYFGIFENLEGPIRINVSAARNRQLEFEFHAIRRMIGDGEPAEAIEQRMRALVTALRALVPRLEGGHVIVAEPARSAPASHAPASHAPAATGSAEPAATHAAPPAPAAPVSPPSPQAARSPAVAAAGEPVAPVWQATLAGIGQRLDGMLAALRQGDAPGARRQVQEAHFELYRNSYLESTLRRHRDAGINGEINQIFYRLNSVIATGGDAAAAEPQVNRLNALLAAAVPGLPVPDRGAAAASATASAGPADWPGVRDRISASLVAALDQYRQGQGDAAMVRVQDTYFDVFEGSQMESTLATVDDALVTQIEAKFSRIVALIRAGAPPAEIETVLGAMSADLDRAVARLADSQRTPWTLFVSALLIIVREGFEAILIITGLFAYLAKVGRSDRAPVIRNAVVVALGLSVVTAFAIAWAFEVSAASQEVLEGATMLLASAVLFSVSYWLISKASERRWMAYIKDTMGASLSSGSLAALWFAAFLAVYREGAETVLFFQALVLSAGAAGHLAVAGGFAAGCVVLAALYLVMRLGAMRLPLGPFFIITGGVLYALAFVFAGQGVMELIEGRVLSPSIVPGAPEWPALGVYPYVETLVPQGLLAVAAVLALIVALRSARQRARAAA